MLFCWKYPNLHNIHKLTIYLFKTGFDRAYKISYTIAILGNIRVRKLIAKSS